MILITNVKTKKKIFDKYSTNCILVTMGPPSGKVAIVIIACISVVVIATIAIPIVVIYSGEESTKNSTKIPTTITTTQTTQQQLLLQRVHLI